jgi:sec-independent protein translocase protein TatA
VLRDLFSGWHIVILLGVVVLLFGSRRLPALAKGLGQSLRIFKSEIDVDAPRSDPETVDPDPLEPEAA